MKMCCQTFEGLTLNAGEKGFSIIPFHKQDFLFFLLQYRSESTSVKEGIIKIADIGIKYCPFCGKELAKIISKNKSYVIQLAEKNKGLIY